MNCVPEEKLKQAFEYFAKKEHPELNLERYGQGYQHDRTTEAWTFYRAGCSNFITIKRP